MKEETRLPAALLESLSGVPGFDAGALEAVHQSGRQVTSLRVNPAKMQEPHFSGMNIAAGIPWSRFGYYLSERPSFTLDPLLHAGAYYVQEASSMFLEQALQQTTDLSLPLKVLDLCGAPGGKSTHIQSLLNQESVLVTNEVIRNRANILVENITKWGAANTIVTNNDPSAFAAFGGLFDVIVVDAPCSGSGLFRKDPEAVSEWSLANVQHCSLRQQRILADVWPALKPGGILVYSTCSYSMEEDEMITDWMTETTGAQSVKLSIPEAWGIVPSVSPEHRNIGYRFYPDKLMGEGFYLAGFRKKDGLQPSPQRQTRYKPNRKLVELATRWVNHDDDLAFYDHKQQLYAMREKTLACFLQVQPGLNVRKAGLLIGEATHGDIIPDHALALSTIHHPEIEKIALDKEAALAFLRKAPLPVADLPKGWLMVTHESLPLGWIKSLGNRVNNYYPPAWRIRM